MSFDFKNSCFFLHILYASCLIDLQIKNCYSTLINLKQRQAHNIYTFIMNGSRGGGEGLFRLFVCVHVFVNVP